MSGHQHLYSYSRNRLKHWKCTLRLIERYENGVEVCGSATEGGRAPLSPPDAELQ